MLYNTNVITHCNPNKKIVLLTTLRTGSSWCEKNLTQELGWLPKCQITEFGLDRLVEYFKEGYNFYVTVKEPYLRLTSGMEMVVPPLTDYSLDPMIVQQVFASAISLVVHKHSFSDLNDYGILNYTCGDGHMSWGVHVAAMFLESLGIRCTPLILDSNNLLLDSKPRQTQRDFTSFVESLGMQSHQTRVSPEKTVLRSLRYGAWLQVCTKSFNANPAGFQVLTPTYSVYDWLNNDNYLYNSFLDLDSYDKSVRQQEAQKRVLMVINEMWAKLNIEGIFKGIPYRQRNNLVYPWDTMFDLMRMFIEYESVFPEFYDRIHSNNLFQLPDHYQFVPQEMGPG